MKNLKNLVWVLALIGIDQYTKFYAHQNLASPVKILDFFQLKLVQNTGIAFSLPVPQWIVIGLTMVVLLGLCYHLFLKKNKAFSIAPMVLILAGLIMIFFKLKNLKLFLASQIFHIL